jgi:transcriptional regulator with XRE-family HTH domain
MTTNRVRVFRERRRWTLKHLAALAGTTESHLSKIERGLVEPFGITKEAIADALEMPRAEVFPAQPETAEASA